MTSWKGEFRRSEVPHREEEEETRDGWAEGFREGKAVYGAEMDVSPHIGVTKITAMTCQCRPADGNKQDTCGC